MQNTIAILVPIYKTILEPDERISLHLCASILAQHPVFLLAPHTLDIIPAQTILPNAKVLRLPAHHFKSIGHYSRMLLRPKFYKRFLDYEYILIYQTDALVFKDDLLEWCSKGYDYIGAPHVHRTSQGIELLPVFNGGLSLRKVATFVKILTTVHIVNTSRVWINRLKSRKTFLKKVCYIPELLAKLIYKNITWSFLRTYNHNEDIFFSEHGKQFFPTISLPSPEVASKFSFEKEPAELFEANNHQLPFGAHAWQLYQPEFWRQILKETYFPSLTP